MNKKFFGAVVAPISIVGLTFALGLGTTAFGAGEQQQNQNDSLINTLNVTTDIPVAPWCGWYVSGGVDGALSLEPADGATEYIGDEIALTATADENRAYVGPNDGLEEQGAEEDCSWFVEGNKYGARYDVVASNDSFTATALLSVGGPAADPGMDFKATDANPLSITNVGIESCSLEGFQTDAGAELKTGALETTPWTVPALSVTNINFCEWSAKYDINIPGDMSPLYGNVTYRWTGPTLTHTLVIPETQP
jgi:hypothetical protein